MDADHCRIRRWHFAFSLSRRAGYSLVSVGGNLPCKLEFARIPSSVGKYSGRYNGSRGFTAVELIIVVAVTVTLAAIAVPYLLSSIYQADLAKAVGDIHAIETDLTGYESTNGQLPDTLAQVGDDMILDPWGNPYQYLNHATVHGNGKVRKDRFLVPLNSDYDLYSIGKDGKTASPITASVSQDDVIRVGSADYIGLASQF